MPIEEVNLLSHTRWLIDPIPLESDKTLTNGPAPAWAVLGRTAGSRGAAVSTASPVPLSHHTSTGFDQWGHSSDTHTYWDRSWARHHMIKRPRGYCFPTIHPTKKEKKNFIKLRQQHLPFTTSPSPLFLPFFSLHANLDWLERERRLSNLR